MFKNLFTFILALLATQAVAQSGNRYFSTAVGAGLDNAFSATRNPNNWKPSRFSDIATMASFEHPMFQEQGGQRTKTAAVDPFWTVVTYAGAVDPTATTTWLDAAWINWSPQTTPYPATTATLQNGTTFGSASITSVDNVLRIASNMTIPTGTYSMPNDILVTDGAVLTIQAGAIFRGPGTLVITRGCQINAQGTATNPIVFTSNRGVNGRIAGDAGGIVILGRAINNNVNNRAPIEGFPAGNDLLTFGYGDGSNSRNDAESSGTLRYIRIEFGGKVLQSNNEINSLTMGGVGSGTTIEYIQCSYGADDAFEWFGGSVNAKYLIAYGTFDDEFDTSDGFNGKVQFAVGVRDPFLLDGAQDEPRAIESDGRGSGWENLEFYTNAIFSNFTLVGPSLNGTPDPGAGLTNRIGSAARLRRNTSQRVFNSVITGYPDFFHITDAATWSNYGTTPVMWDSIGVINNNAIIGGNTGVAAVAERVFRVVSGSTLTTTSWYSLANELAVSRASANSNLTTLLAYPNPAQAQLNVAVYLNSAAAVNVEIMNANGQVVATQAQNTLGTGRHIISVGTANLANGTYIARVSAGAETLSTRFVVQK